MNKIPFPLRQQNITYTCFQRPATLAEGGRTATFTYNGDDERVKMNVTDGTGSVLTRYYLGGRYELDVTLGNTREKMYLGCRLMGKLLLKHIIPHTYSIEFMKKHNRIFIYIIFGLLNSCIIPDVGVSCICLRNKTDKPIACYRTDGTFGISYPDIIFPWDDATDVQKLRVNVMDWEYLMCGRARNDYHWFWNTQQNVLSFYIFDQEKVDSLGWETIIANNDYLVRYDVTPEDISSLIYDKECEGCCLDYPPSPSMKGIRMSPPYEEVIANAKKKY